MLKNLAKLDQTEMDKVNVDLAAAGVALNVNSLNICAAGFASGLLPTVWLRSICHVYLTSPNLNKTYTELHFLT